jgi:hypothetical protein
VVLRQRALNRALVARQLLLERARVPLPAALSRVAGLQAQYAPSMYIGLWSRLEEFARDDLTRALERREVVQGTLMRTTIHLVAREDYWPFALAVRADRRAWWLKVVRDAPSPQAMAGAARTLRRALAGGATLSRREIQELVGRERFPGVGQWIELVRAPPSGTWERRRADLYAAAEDWLGPPEIDVGAAKEHLARRYLAAFGPAPGADVARWAGIPPVSLRRALGAPELRRFRGESGEELLDVPDAPLPDPDTPAPPRLLGTFDASLLVHARRTGFLPEEHRPRFFDTQKPQSLFPFTVDGVVRGAWRYGGGHILLDPFERLDPASMRALREEADRLAAFHAR